LPQLAHTVASRAIVPLHDGHRVGLDTVERTFQTKKMMPPTTAMTMAKTMSSPGVHMQTIELGTHTPYRAPEA
jgi:hypothetical protein